MAGVVQAGKRETHSFRGGKKTPIPKIKNPHLTSYKTCYIKEETKQNLFRKSWAPANFWVS